MIVKYEDSLSNSRNLVGGGAQGTLLAGIEYIVATDDCGNEKVPNSEDNNSDSNRNKNKYRYFDDLHVLELLILSDKLVEYSFYDHVASDIATDHKFLPSEQLQTQEYLNEISNWTDKNLMKLNETKSKYIVFSRSKEEFSTRLFLNDTLLDRVSVIRVLRVWLQEDMKWNENTKQICMKAYSRISILCKLKYAGIKIEDLITIYILFIRSLAEYCSVAFHSSLTESLSNKLESIQRTSLRIILAENYVSYSAALEMSGLLTLEARRESRQLTDN